MSWQRCSNSCKHPAQSPPPCLQATLARYAISTVLILSSLTLVTWSVSCCALLTRVSAVQVLYGISQHHAALPGPSWLHFVIVFLVLVLLGYLEGLQVAILAVEGAVDAETIALSHPQCYAVMKLSLKENNVQRCVPPPAGPF